LINSSPLFALSVIAPSLVFGYFRDYCNSVYPSIIIHSAYNAMVFAGLILYGNMSFPLL
jgi:membrane protease YdiL (CAAX protease family)